MPRASVVIPAHRLDRWLDEAVASALASTMTDLEVIVVVNGTPIVEEPQWAFEGRVTLLGFDRPLGPVGATSAGLEKATGEYYVHLDADDLMSTTRIERQIDYFREHPETRMVGAMTSFIDSDGNRTGAFLLPAGPDVRRQLVGVNVVPHSVMTVRLQDLADAGGYNSDLEQMEDYELILRMAIHGPVANLATEEALYRRHAGQVHKAVRPRGNYIDAVRDARLGLASAIGMSGVERWYRHNRWMAEQHAQFIARSIQNAPIGIRRTG
jgi:glycosyltransferase involved in cell wall biosynthesis